jgi:hypothetical protein
LPSALYEEDAELFRLLRIQQLGTPEEDPEDTEETDIPMEEVDW